MLIEVIKRVNQLGKEQNQPTLLTFQDRHGHSTMDPDPYFQPVDIDIEGVKVWMCVHGGVAMAVLKSEDSGLILLLAQLVH